MAPLTPLLCLQELRRQFETISELRGEIKTLQADNLKLYEKVRYLQSYRDDGGSARAGGSAAAGTQAGFRTVVRGDEELGKYHSKYEESMNPFEKFRGQVGLPYPSLFARPQADSRAQERTRGVANLNPIEKILLQLSGVVLRGRFSRNLFVLYAFGLHFLLLSTLYSQTTGVSGGVATVPAPVVQPF